MKDKCIIICNGDSVQNIHQYGINYSEYDLIAVNRWDRVFKLLKLPPPNIVIIGKNSLKENLKYINNREISFVGIPYHNAPNYSYLHFGQMECHGKHVEFWDKLWWSGIYAIQYALQKEYKEIYIFGFSCTNANDFRDNIKRAPIPELHFLRVIEYFRYLHKIGLLDICNFAEKYSNHPVLSQIYKEYRHTVGESEDRAEFISP